MEDTFYMSESLWHRTNEFAIHAIVRCCDETRDGKKKKLLQKRKKSDEKV